MGPRSSSPTVTASPTATTCVTAWTSRRPRCCRVTGRCSATIPGCRAKAKTRPRSTRRHRACRSTSTSTTRRVTRCSPTAIRRRPSGFWPKRRRMGWSAGASTSIGRRCRARRRRPEKVMSDLSTRYLGLTFRNPLVASPPPLSEPLANPPRRGDGGGGAVVLHSLFEEQINLESHHLDRYLSLGTESYAESLSYFPDMTSYNLGPDAYLEHVRRAKAAVDFPILGSLNGVSTGGWITYAQI